MTGVTKDVAARREGRQAKPHVPESYARTPEEKDAYIAELRSHIADLYIERDVAWSALAEILLKFAEWDDHGSEYAQGYSDGLKDAAEIAKRVEMHDGN